MIENRANRSVESSCYGCSGGEGVADGYKIRFGEEICCDWIGSV